MKKTIVCFANSRKIDGKCFAGKDINDKSWIRPVSNNQNESLSEKAECIRGNNCKCIICNPKIPTLLDVVEIDLGHSVCDGHQVENYLFSSIKWKKIKTLGSEHIDDYLDICKGDLWINGFHTWNRKNDRIPANSAYLLKDSLRLIEVQALGLLVVTEGADFGNPKKKVNGRFIYNDIEYIIPITDLEIEKIYNPLKEGIYDLSASGKRIILCLSIGKVFKDYIYKFIAGVMTV